MTQVSVEPNTSRTSQPKRASAAAASSCDSGAVAETMPHSGGSDTLDSISARKCTGVVASKRGSGVSANARATSSGKNGRPVCRPAGPSNGNSTDSSMPYMCCGGTVATMWGIAWPCHRLSNAAMFWPVLARNADQTFGLAVGAPVLPEVKPIATTAESSIVGVSPGACGSGSGSNQCPGGAIASRPSPRL